MRRLFFLTATLILACAAAGFAATIPPLAGTVDLTEQNITRFYGHPGNLFYRADDRKPDGIRIELPIMDKVFYHEFRLGPMENSRYMVYGKDKNKYIEYMYFDSNGDNVITEDESIPVCIYSSRRTDGTLYWFTEPLQPLKIPVDYRHSDGSVFTKDLTMSVSFLTIQQASSRTETMLYGLSVMTMTWFMGEIPAGGGRLLKVAVADMNGDGVFNDNGVDALIIDKNLDSVLDWEKERLILGKTWKGLSAEGKKVSLVPAVAAWPQKLILIRKGSAVDPVQLESR